MTFENPLIREGLLDSGARLERLWTGGEWVEGPAWLPGPGVLRFSDIPHDRILDFDPATGETRVHRTGVEYVNGRTVDHEGRVVQCSHGLRRVERETAEGVEALVDAWEGRRLNSPNDVVVASDGAIWFTDPPYGIHESGREGHPGEPEYGGCHVFRFEEATGRLAAVVTDMVHPNGLAFSPDESVLYVSDTGYPQVPGARSAIRAYDVVDGECRSGRTFVEVLSGGADGFRVDRDGRVWTSSRDSVQVFDRDGRRVGGIPVPEPVSNVAFGGRDGDELYITASTSLYRIRVATTAAPRPVAGR